MPHRQRKHCFFSVGFAIKVTPAKSLGHFVFEQIVMKIVTSPKISFNIILLNLAVRIIAIFLLIDLSIFSS